MLTQFALEGRVALVTGSARGLGFEIARGMAEAGARVYINGTDEARLRSAAGRLAGHGVEVHPACFDVTDEVLAQATIGRIAAECGRLDILVNNVGVRLREPLENIGSPELRRMLDVDLVSAFALAKLAAAHMAGGGYGRIINISSVAALRARRSDAAYIMVKGAMNAMTRSLAAEFGPLGITCNALMPGGFLTETNEHLKSPEAREMFKARMPLGRAGAPAEIAGPAVFLASPAASYVTGVCLAVDGGALATG
jgi:gluconate 5-dehydrogenase